MSSEHKASKDKPESYVDMIGKFAYRLKFMSSVRHTSMDVNKIRVLNHSLSIMRDIDLSGSAPYIKIYLNTSAT